MAGEKHPGVAVLHPAWVISFASPSTDAFYQTVYSSVQLFAPLKSSASDKHLTHERKKRKSAFKHAYHFKLPL